MRQLAEAQLFVEVMPELIALFGDADDDGGDLVGGKSKGDRTCRTGGTVIGDGRQRVGVDGEKRPAGVRVAPDQKRGIAIPDEPAGDPALRDVFAAGAVKSARL